MLYDKKNDLWYPGPVPGSGKPELRRENKALIFFLMTENTGKKKTFEFTRFGNAIEFLGLELEVSNMIGQHVTT